MAGAILLTENICVSLSSVCFEYIVEKIRPNFNAGEDAIREAVYSPVDEGGLSFISLKEQGAEGFNAFVRAASIACENDIREKPQSAYRRSWRELMSALRSDLRSQNPGSIAMFLD